MLTRQEVIEVQQLASRGLSVNKISRQTGIAYDTISRIVNGKHRFTRSNGSNEDNHLRYATNPIERCPGCGRMIEMPCRACQAIAYRDAGRADEHTPNLDAAQPEGVQ